MREPLHGLVANCSLTNTTAMATTTEVKPPQMLQVARDMVAEVAMAISNLNEVLAPTVQAMETALHNMERGKENSFLPRQ